MGVVTIPEFNNYLSGMNVTDIQSQSMAAILDGVQSELERYLNRPVQQQRIMEEVDVDFNGNAYLGVTPIAEVYGIYRSGANGEPDMQQALLPSTAGGFFRKNANYLRIGMYAGATVYVDYKGGINADKNPGIKLAIMRVAAREFMHNHGDAMTLENTEARPASDPTPQPKGWTDQELIQFDRLRRRTVM